MAGSEAAGGGLTRPQAEDFLYREARLLDERRFEEWLALLTPDARYVVPAGDARDAGTPAVALVDDDRPTLEDRVRRLRSPATYAQSPPSSTVRLVGAVEVEAEATGADVLVRSVWTFQEARLGKTRTFAARCAHRLRPVDGAWRIALKRVELAGRGEVWENLTFLL